MCLLLNQITLHYPHLSSMSRELISLELTRVRSRWSVVELPGSEEAERKGKTWNGITHSKNQDGMEEKVGGWRILSKLTEDELFGTLSDRAKICFEEPIH